MLSGIDIYSDSIVQELILQLGFTADLELTFLVIVIWHSPVAVQCDANLAFLMRFEVLAVHLHSIGMCKNHVAPNTLIICKNECISRQKYYGKHKIGGQVHGTDLLTSRAQLKSHPPGSEYDR